MKKTMIIVLAVLLITAIFPVHSIVAQSSIVIFSPSTQVTRLPEARDYATSRFSDPWDMTNKEDGGLFNENFRNVSMSGGMWNGTTNSTSGRFWIQWGGYPGSYSTGREGLVNKINAGYYKRFSVKMYSSKSGNGRLWWFWTQNMKKKGWVNIPVSSGWNIYRVNLPSNWSGSLTGLRFDPITKTDARVKIDWIRLTPVITNANAQIAWNDNSRGGTASIFLDNDSFGYDGMKIADVKSTIGTNNYKLNTSGLAPGNYYVYIVKNGEYSSYSSGPIIINQSPVFKITDPDISGGTDWAQSHIKNSWNMSQYNDAERYKNITRKKISRGVLSGVNFRQTLKNDPFVWLRLAHKLINTNNYRYLSFRYKYDGSFDLRRGTMSRFYWLSAGHGWNTSDDIVTYSGWRTYNVDLKKIKLNGGAYGWRGNTVILRFDPHEDRYSRRFYLDYVKLAAEDKLSSSFAIKYTNKDRDNSNVTLKLYWDTDKVFGNGNERLITKKGIGNGSSYYRWRPSRSLKKRVWVYAQVSDGINTNGYYSTGMLRVHI